MNPVTESSTKTNGFLFIHSRIFNGDNILTVELDASTLGGVKLRRKTDGLLQNRVTNASFVEILFFFAPFCTFLKFREQNHVLHSSKSRNSVFVMKQFAHDKHFA